jgi:tripartite-type tricarboxylate transporter receptor subunit TctC
MMSMQRYAGLVFLHPRHRARFNALFAVAILMAAVNPPLFAQAPGYPSRPVRLVVPSSPGGGLDFIARITAVRLTSRWQQQVVSDNRAGAAGIIGTDIVAKAPPDGYTLLVPASDFVAARFFYDKLPYATPESFAPITILGIAPYILVAHPSSGIRTVKELLAAAKEKPGQLAYASAGVGTTAHLSMMILSHQARGLDLVHIPYKGAGPAAAAVLSGEVPFLMASPSMSVPHINSGKLRALAVTSSKRVAILPDLPTVAESGIPGYEATVWIALMAPAKTPKPVIDKIYADVLEVLKMPEYAAQMRAAGWETGGMAPADFTRHIKNEMNTVRAVTKEVGIRVDR